VSSIDIFVPVDGVCRMHALVAERLAGKGHDVALVGIDAPTTASTLDHILFLERKILGSCSDCLIARVDAPLQPARPDARLRIDMSGSGALAQAPLLRPGFVGCHSYVEAARLLMLGRLPDIEIILDDAHRIGFAAPMVESRLSIARGLNDVLARMVTLLVDTADRYLRDEFGSHDRAHTATTTVPPTSAQMISAYVLSTMPRQAAGAIRRMGFHVHNWRVSYRFNEGPKVAETGSLGGEPWLDLPDDGRRFYADPFPFEWQGRHFIFVEELPHGEDKAFISVAEVSGEGVVAPPRMVLQEPYHLSYPQVFSHAGEIWMLPEGGAGGNLVLYRAEAFPDRWVRHSVLIPGREMFDATILEHGGRLWLFASERDGYGSSSDMLVIYHAATLEGPWLPHVCNPVRIDRTAARPGGRFARVGNRTVLPLQDGTESYGSGLGLAELVRLDEKIVQLTQPVPLLTSADLPRPKVHTLNRSGDLEVIDRISPAPRAAFRRVV